MTPHSAQPGLAKPALVLPLGIGPCRDDASFQGGRLEKWSRMGSENPRPFQLLAPHPAWRKEAPLGPRPQPGNPELPPKVLALKRTLANGAAGADPARGLAAANHVQGSLATGLATPAFVLEKPTTLAWKSPPTRTFLGGKALRPPVAMNERPAPMTLTRSRTMLMLMLLALMAELLQTTIIPLLAFLVLFPVIHPQPLSRPPAA